MLEVYIDGACEPNPGGTASYGVVVFQVDSFTTKEGYTSVRELPLVGEVVWKVCKIVGSGTGMSNNVAEYAGLVAFLEWYQSQNCLEKTTVSSDSQLLVNQMKGTWKVKKGLYIPYYEKATSLALQIEGVGRKLFEFKWISRDDNQLADALSVKALAEVGIRRRK